jgi:hypothetical protein
MFRKLLAIVSTIMVIASLNCTAYAKTANGEDRMINSDVGLRYTYISSTAVILTINSLGKATCSATLSAYDTVDSVRISAYLQYYDDGWYTDAHWTVDRDGSYAVLSKERYVVRGEYRLLVYYYAYSGNSFESTSDVDYYTY